jgi:hypothetical protein
MDRHRYPSRGLTLPGSRMHFFAAKKAKKVEGEGLLIESLLAFSSLAFHFVVFAFLAAKFTAVFFVSSVFL